MVGSVIVDLVIVNSVIVGSVTGFGISLITLLGLEGYNPLTFYPTRIFLLVRALSLVGLYR
jgi:hypothetical protein